MGRPGDVVQPFEFGHDASKATCLWFFDADGNALDDIQLQRDPEAYVAPRLVRLVQAMGRSDVAKASRGPKFLPRWGNQTDSGQNRESPGDDRAGIRSRTYEGIGAALAAALHNHVTKDKACS